MTRVLTASPGVKISGLIRLSLVGPYELNAATVSTSAYPLVPSAIPPSALVEPRRVGPDAVAPTVRMFLEVDGEPIVQGRPSSTSPSLPAGNISRFSGFCVSRTAQSVWSREETRSRGEIGSPSISGRNRGHIDQAIQSHATGGSKCSSPIYTKRRYVPRYYVLCSKTDSP